MIKPGRDIHLLPRNLEPREGNQENKDLQRFDLNYTVINELVDHYIDKIHDRPHSLFHLPTLRENVQSQSINEPLLLAICSLGSRLSKRPDIRSLEPQLTYKAKSLILADLENICLENIQTCILVANICGANGSPSSEALFFREFLNTNSILPPPHLSILISNVGIAFGMAQILRLPTLDLKDTVVVSEIKRRVWWTIFMADRWYSAGLDLPRQIKETERSSDLPMDETTFHSLPVGQITLDSPWRPGLWAHMITLVDLFGPIQDLNRHIVQENLDDAEIDRCAYELSCRLDAWEDMLPVDTKFNTENLDQHKSRGTGGPFAALHLGFHHYSTLLYFQYLESKGDSTTTTSAFAERCKHHASAYSALLKFSRENDGFQAVYPTVGHMAIVSSSVLLYTLLFGDETQIPSARNSLNANFEALIELEEYWPALKSMVGYFHFNHT